MSEHTHQDSENSSIQGLEISTLSPALQTALKEELQKLPKDTPLEKGLLTAMKAVVARTYAGEEGLLDLSFSGDYLALTLAEME
jgi:hypothetical protein